MESFEAKLTRATDPGSREILGAIGVVLNSKGKTLYTYASGGQSLAPDTPSLDPESTLFMASAGKFITHIAGLQLAERGIVTLDEPVYNHLPELEKLEIISSDPDPTSGVKYTLRPTTKPITLRHMLTHTSGIGHESEPLIQAWIAATPPQQWPEGTPQIVQRFSQPLLFEPGEGWSYGHSVHWLQLYVERAAGQKFITYIQEHIFDPLRMKMSSYLPHKREDLSEMLLQMVERKEDGSLEVAPEGTSSGLVCSVPDVKAILGDLIAPESKILQKESVDVFFEPAFSPSSPALKDMRAAEEYYCKTIGFKPETGPPPPVNYSIGGLVVEEQLQESNLPARTLTWNGMPNLIWAMNREKGIATFFATQLIPVDDEKTVAHMVEFLRCAWAKFG
ncbi:beta-lactamase family protein [Xylariales sp. AK1849]|nr:beta-lactamase family protein [Xylariales sp. AK1849]